MNERRRTPPSLAETAVVIPAGGARLAGTLALSPTPSGVVLFAHGSGSSRHSPRNRHVAQVLLEAGLGTLLFDLLTAAEDRDYRTRFDIELLTARLLSREIADMRVLIDRSALRAMGLTHINAFVWAAR